MSVDVSGWQKKRAAIEKQVRFATAKALTLVAKDAQADLRPHMGQVFDRPTPFTLGSIGIQPATKEVLQSVVFVKDAMTPILARQEVGGTLTPQPGAPVTVPVNIRQTAAGNIPRGAIKRMVARPDVFVSNQRDPRVRHLPPGVYQRYKAPKGRTTRQSKRSGISTAQGQARKARPPKLLISLERQTQYQPRFRMRERVLMTVQARFKNRFAESMALALRSAR